MRPKRSRVAASASSTAWSSRTSVVSPRPSDRVRRCGGSVSVAFPDRDPAHRTRAVLRRCRGRFPRRPRSRSRPCRRAALPLRKESSRDHLRFGEREQRGPVLGQDEAGPDGGIGIRVVALQVVGAGRIELRELRGGEGFRRADQEADRRRVRARARPTASRPGRPPGACGSRRSRCPPHCGAAAARRPGATSIRGAMTGALPVVSHVLRAW